MNAKRLAALGVASLALATAAGAARADDQQPAAGAPAPAAPGAPAAPASAPAGPTALATPAMSASLSNNSDPLNMDWGPLGKIYVSGQVTGFGMIQTASPDRSGKHKADLSNLQFEIQKTDGVVQFYVQAGEYNIPSLATPVLNATKFTESTYRFVPNAYVKLVPNSDFNVEIGILPTLVGAEYSFTFQNLNINRGLLWNQEPAISRGIQGNYTHGPLTVSLAVTDGYYSSRYTTLSGLVSYALTMKDTVAGDFSAQLDKTNKSTFATPIAQNNGTIWNLSYTHTEDKWMVNPYLQYSTTPKEVSFGLPSSASTFGAAVLGKYSVTSMFNVAGRVEYISSSGSQVSLLYGPKSDAWSFTITPTLQIKTYFIRGEFAYVKIDKGTKGFELGAFANKSEQSRAMIEAGVLF